MFHLHLVLVYYIKWGFESRLKHRDMTKQLDFYYIKWGFESRLKRSNLDGRYFGYYIKWGFESRLKLQIKC